MSDLQRLEHKLEVEHRAWVAETVRLATVNSILHGRIDELKERMEKISTGARETIEELESRVDKLEDGD